MTKTLAPTPQGANRAKIARRIRVEAADIAQARARPPQRDNGECDEALKRAGEAPGRMVAAHGTFTKGLPHDAYGRVDGDALTGFVDALNQHHVDDSQDDESPFPGVYKGPDAGKAARFKPTMHGGGYTRPSNDPSNPRGFESPLAGHVFDLEGADADASGLPPAPKIDSDELIAEMAEVYVAALLRDEPFENWSTAAAGYASMLAKLPFFKNGQSGRAETRRQARGAVSADTLLRGSTRGAKDGPYLSQFLLVGSAERDSLTASDQESNAIAQASMQFHASDARPQAARFAAQHAMASGKPGGKAAPEDGFIRYGVQAIDQRFTGHLEGWDHMTEWATWLDVQNGSNRKDSFDRYRDTPRFAATPRDLASFVHFDELEQAYRNAALLLLGAGQPTDAGLPEGVDHATRHAFATFGGPHLLALLSEVASRALKAVRRQKYNIHLRARPEAVAAAISMAWADPEAGHLGDMRAPLAEMVEQLSDIGLLEEVRRHNGTQNKKWAEQYTGGIDLGPLTPETNALLPMAYPEGSPMHPAYGAGHATVAGACVTILKAFFEMFNIDGTYPRGEVPHYSIIDMTNGVAKRYPAELFGDERPINEVEEEKEDPENRARAPRIMLPALYGANPAADPPYSKLESIEKGKALSIQGELDKLAANIAIARNFAGVHYYTDYYESLRLGERVAVALLQEQMLTYREPVSMRFTSFDGEHVMIAGTGGSRGLNDALVMLWSAQDGAPISFDDWWSRHA